MSTLPLNKLTILIIVLIKIHHLILMIITLGSLISVGIRLSRTMNRKWTMKRKLISTSSLCLHLIVSLPSFRNPLRFSTATQESPMLVVPHPSLPCIPVEFHSKFYLILCLLKLINCFLPCRNWSVKLNKPSL